MLDLTQEKKFNDKLSSESEVIAQNLGISALDASFLSRAYLMIAILVEGRSVIGFRLYDLCYDTAEDYTRESVESRLMDGSVMILNLAYVTEGTVSKVICTSGDFLDYAVLDKDGFPITQYNPFTFLACFDNMRFLCVDYRGNVQDLGSSIGVGTCVVNLEPILTVGFSNLCVDKDNLASDDVYDCLSSVTKSCIIRTNRCYGAVGQVENRDDTLSIGSYTCWETNREITPTIAVKQSKSYTSIIFTKLLLKTVSIINGVYTPTVAALAGVSNPGRMDFDLLAYCTSRKLFIDMDTQDVLSLAYAPNAIPEHINYSKALGIARYSNDMSEEMAYERYYDKMQLLSQSFLGAHSPSGYLSVDWAFSFYPQCFVFSLSDRSASDRDSIIARLRCTYCDRDTDGSNNTLFAVRDKRSIHSGGINWLPYVQLRWEREFSDFLIQMSLVNSAEEQRSDTFDKSSLDYTAMDKMISAISFPYLHKIYFIWSSKGKDVIIDVNGCPYELSLLYNHGKDRKKCSLSLKIHDKGVFLKFGASQFLGNNAECSLLISGGTEVIGSSLLSRSGTNSRSMKFVKVTVTSPLKVIGYEAFMNCGYLKSVDLPSTVRIIGCRAFACCDSLTSFDVPDECEEIGAEAFAGCSALSTLVIPASVKVIGARAFQDCGELHSLVIKGTPLIDITAFTNCNPVVQAVADTFESFDSSRKKRSGKKS